MKNKLMHRLRFAKAHFHLGRVDVDVHGGRVQRQKQRIAGVAVVVQHVVVGLAHGMIHQLVAHKAAVDKKILRIAAAFAQRRAAGKAAQRQAGGLGVHAQRASGKVIAQ